jgi:hypothetical protein
VTRRPGASSRGADLAWGALAAAALLLVNVAYVASSLGFLHKPRRVLETDHFRYIEMARAPGSTDAAVRTAPFCWRVLTPWLAHLLSRAGLGLNPAFYLLTNLFLFAFLLTLFLHLRDLGHGLGMSLLGVTLGGLVQGAVRWYEYQYWMTDPLCLFLVMLTFCLIQRGRDAAWGAVSVAGILSRESYLLVLAYGVLRRLRAEGRGAGLWRALATGSVAVAVLVALRAAIVPVNDPESMRTVERAVAFRLRHAFDNQVYLLSVGSLGVLVPMILLSPRRLIAWCRSRYDEAAYLALVYLSLVMGNNTERLLAYGLPVVVPLALLQLERFAEEARTSLPLVAGACLGLQALFWAQTRLLGEQGLSAYQPANTLVAFAMATFWLACWLRLRFVRYEVKPA